MKYRLITVVLACVTIGLGFWAWQEAHDRDFDVVFGTSGDEALRWAEQAKNDKWVDLVEIVIVDGRVTNEKIPRDQIDHYVQTNETVLVRRWLPNDLGAGMTGALATHGYPDMAEFAGETAASAARQRSAATWLTIATVIAGLATVASGVVTARRGRSDSSAVSS